jgi:transposase
MQALHASLKHIPGSANYVLCVLGSLYKRITVDWELSDMRIPSHGVRRFKMKTRERFLTPEERRHVEEVLLRGLQIPPGRKGHLDRMGVWALQLLSLTGLRRDEIRDLTWPMVDWQHSCLNLPDTKTGQRNVPVPSQVMALLRQIHDRTGNRKEGLVVHSRTGRKLSGLNLTWKNIREAVGIPDVRLHDLRHSFASDALMGGVPLAIVGEMLGHRQPNTTKRYAHLANRVVREALEHTAGIIVAATNMPRALPVAPFEPLRDVQWAAIVTLVDADRPRGGKPVDLRQVVDGIRWVLHTQGHWSDIPASYAASTTCWRWYKRWCADGTWPKVEAQIAAPSATSARQPKPRARPLDKCALTCRTTLQGDRSPASPAPRASRIGQDACREEGHGEDLGRREGGIRPQVESRGMGSGRDRALELAALERGEDLGEGQAVVDAGADPAGLLRGMGRPARGAGPDAATDDLVGRE